MAIVNSKQKDNLTYLVHPPKPVEPPKPQPAPQTPRPGQVTGSNGNPITLGFGSQRPSDTSK